MVGVADCNRAAEKVNWLTRAKELAIWVQLGEATQCRLRKSAHMLAPGTCLHLHMSAA